MYQCEYIAVLAGSGLTIHFPENQQHTFHLSMAQLRILRLQRVKGSIVNAVQVILDKKGLSNRDKFTFLDCTIGLGSDSMVVSYGYPQAQITGLEGSLPIWLATSHGLAHYIHSEDSVTNALRRIKVNHDTFEHYLSNLLDNSIDIIYFDPMFEVPVEESPQFKPLRGHTVESHIDDKIMAQAMRVATYVLLLKNDHLFGLKNIHRINVGGKYSRIGYGVYMKELM
ncbi:MAG: protein-L-IsoD(D-D) O-methyltransferase [Veillonella sp.]